MAMEINPRTNGATSIPPGWSGLLRRPRNSTSLVSIRKATHESSVAGTLSVPTVLKKTVIGKHYDLVSIKRLDCLWGTVMVASLIHKF